MTGNVPELYDPGNANGYINSYPNSVFTTNGMTPEPSIREEKLYILLMLFL